MKYVVYWVKVWNWPYGPVENMQSIVNHWIIPLWFLYNSLDFLTGYRRLLKVEKL
jgi:hypothetical protein